MDIYLLNFNNYYNRQIKLFELLSNYTEFLCKGSTYGNNPINGVNFNPGNGINSAQVINWDGDNPDYIIAADGNEIISRWYVIQSERLRNGQFRLVLYRDLVADYYEEVMRAPMFIEKGYVNPNDSAIWNSEEGSFNEIKTYEHLLKDSTKCPWIVGYVAPPKDTESFKFNYGGEPAYDFYAPTLEEFELYNFLGESKKKSWITGLPTYIFNVEYTTTEGGFSFDIKDTVMFNSNGLIEHSEGSLDLDSAHSALVVDNIYDFKKYLYYQGAATLYSTAINQFSIQTNTELMYNLIDIKDKILKTDAAYYKLNAISLSKPKETKKVGINSNLGKGYISILNSTNAHYREGKPANEDLVDPGDADANSFMFRYKSTEIYIEYEIISFLGKEEATFPKARPVLNDAPYCMFCIPYGSIGFKHEDTLYATEAASALNVATGIAQGLGSAIYDLQLLPYCPIELVRTTLSDSTYLDLDDQDIESEVSPMYFDNFNTIMFFARKSAGSFNITYNYYLNRDNAIRYKVMQQTTKFRLCSPNYAGVFEYNPYKFTDNLATINVDYTYKPYQPYIHLNPNFSGLYGQDFDDCRGLICGGDYSLPISADAWKQYELNNKNYQLAFDRQIENMEVNNAIQKIREKWGIATGTVSGGVSGASAGFMSGGGGWGAAIGGVIGTGASLAGGLLDYAYNEQLREEAIDYTKDQFGYQLGNIKAIPYTLAKVSAYNINNKVFPFIEVYEATAEEREALTNKIIYNGMSIGRIGKLSDYIPNKPISEWGYFKGQIIRLEDLGDDFLVANTLANELNKGVYII